MTTLEKIGDATFAGEVTNTPGIAMVDFSAAWCAPCRIIEPALAELAHEFAGKARVLSVDTDANPEISARYLIRALPTVLLFEDGVVVERMVGAMSKAAYREKLEKLLAG